MKNSIFNYSNLNQFVKVSPEEEKEKQKQKDEKLLLENDLKYSEYHFLLNNPEIKHENGRFVSKYDELNEHLKKVTYEKIDGMGNKAYILNHGGKRTLVLNAEFSPTDFMQLEQNLKGIGIQRVYGGINQIMNYRELIDPKVEMIRRNTPNLSLDMLKDTCKAITLFATYKLIKKKKDKIKKYLKHKRNRDVSHNPHEHDVEMSKLKLSEKDKYFLSLGEKEQKKLLSAALDVFKKENAFLGLLGAKITDIANSLFDNKEYEVKNPDVLIAESIDKVLSIDSNNERIMNNIVKISENHNNDFALNHSFL